MGDGLSDATTVAADLLAWSGLPAPGRPIFVGGSSRSGTTLLGAMLGVGPDRLTVPEAEFKWQLFRTSAIRPNASGEGHVVDVAAARDYLATDRMFRLWGVQIPADAPSQVDFPSFMAYLVAVFGQPAGKSGTEVWVDHTPVNIRFAQTLIDAFPDARFVHIIRDGRAVAASVLPLDWGPNDAAESALHWSTQVAAGLAAAARWGPEVVHTVHYEDLVQDPAGVLAGICAFAGLDFDESMVERRDYRLRGYELGQQDLVVQPPDPSRIDAWRSQLRPAQIRDFERVTGELLAYLGYDLVFGARAGRPTKLEHAWTRTVSTTRRVAVNKLSFRRRQQKADVDAASS
ncbi:MAG: sulfotransferase family protein [Actinomycetes bacterium]